MSPVLRKPDAPTDGLDLRAGLDHEANLEIARQRPRQRYIAVGRAPDAPRPTGLIAHQIDGSGERAVHLYVLQIEALPIGQGTVGRAP